jgi:hypothetical protein
VKGILAFMRIAVHGGEVPRPGEKVIGKNEGGES